MRIDIITVIPELLESPLRHSILGRAQAKGLAELHVHNLRDSSTNRWRRVDDYPFGGEAGMILQVEPSVPTTRSSTPHPTERPSTRV